MPGRLVANAPCPPALRNGFRGDPGSRAWSLVDAGGDLVELPVAMPKTITAACQLLRYGCPPQGRHRALDLLLALAAVECHASTGNPDLLLPGLLRELVIATTRLVGRTWLKANAEEAASFTALQASLHPPPLPELDHLLACLLSDRFRLPGPSRQPGPVLTPRRTGTDRGVRRFNAAAPLDGQGRDQSWRETAEMRGAHPCDTANCATDPAMVAAVPTWICVLRVVNVEMQRELPSSSRRLGQRSSMSWPPT
jgi:hypothetical protein